MSKPKFKRGQVWLARDGSVVVIDGFKAAYEGNWPMVCHVDGDDGSLAFTADGFFLRPGSGHRLDLIENVTKDFKPCSGT